MLSQMHRKLIVKLLIFSVIPFVELMTQLLFAGRDDITIDPYIARRNRTKM